MIFTAISWYKLNAFGTCGFRRPHGLKGYTDRDFLKGAELEAHLTLNCYSGIHIICVTFKAIIQ